MSRSPEDRSWSWSMVVGATLFSVILGGGTGGAATTVAANFSGYGYWLFVLIPLLMGVVASLFLNWTVIRDPELGWGVAATTFGAISLGMLATRAEGIICLVMVSPLYFLLFVLGYFATRAALDSGGGTGRGASASVVPLLAVGAVIYARHTPEPAIRTQTTVLEIDAPPEEIWPYLFNMEGIPAPGDLPFRAGVAHPVAIRSAGASVGSLRQCVLSTGVMPETVVVSKFPRLMRFEVHRTPSSMRESNPFGEVDAEHLDGYFTVQQGEFRLDPLPGGRTRLTGTSRYALRIYPAAYWDLWADDVVDEIHFAVMGEMKRRVESKRERKGPSQTYSR